MEKYRYFQDAKAAANKMFETSSDNIETLEVRSFSNYNCPDFIVRKESEKFPVIKEQPLVFSPCVFFWRSCLWFIINQLVG